MNTLCSQISTPNRLVVSEYEVPKVLIRKCFFFLKHPVLESITFTTNKQGGQYLEKFLATYSRLNFEI